MDVEELKNQDQAIVDDLDADTNYKPRKKKKKKELAEYHDVTAFRLSLLALLGTLLIIISMILLIWFKGLPENQAALLMIGSVLPFLGSVLMPLIGIYAGGAAPKATTEGASQKHTS